MNRTQTNKSNKTQLHHNSLKNNTGMGSTKHTVRKSSEFREQEEEQIRRIKQ
jgi:hypothetical protein